MEVLEESQLLELPHQEVCEYMNDELNDIIKDPLLKDIPVNPTVDEVKSRLALEKGKAIVVYLNRLDDEIRKMIVFYLNRLCCVNVSSLLRSFVLSIFY